MSPPPDVPPSRRAVQAFRWMLTVWVTLAVLMCVRAVIQPRVKSVYPIFSDAGHCWLRGADLYDQHFWQLQIDEFRYSPIVAAGLVPFGLLPDSLGGVLWRLLNYAVFFGGTAAFWSIVWPGRERFGLWGITCLGWLLVPLALPSFNNGQANPLVIGGVLFALVAVKQQRWNLAAIALAVPILLKVYPLAMALLLLLLYPRQLGWRLALALAVGLLVPFALQDPSYVARQYDGWFTKLLHEDRSHREFADTYRDFHLLLRWVHLPLPHRYYPLVQLAAAAGIAALVLVGRWQRRPVDEQLNRLFDLGCCWMVLFGPATENSTFMLIAPTFALAVWAGFAAPRTVWTRGVLVAIVGIVVGSAIVTALPGGKNWAYPLNPLATLLLFGERLASLSSRAASVPRPDVEERPAHPPATAA